MIICSPLDPTAVRVADGGLDSWLLACSTLHAWHSCRAGCIVSSESRQGLVTRSVFGLVFEGEPRMAVIRRNSFR